MNRAQIFIIAVEFFFWCVLGIFGDFFKIARFCLGAPCFRSMTPIPKTSTFLFCYKVHVSFFILWKSFLKRDYDHTIMNMKEMMKLDGMPTAVLVLLQNKTAYTLSTICMHAILKVEPGGRYSCWRRREDHHSCGLVQWAKWNRQQRLSTITIEYSDSDP